MPITNKNLGHWIQERPNFDIVQILLDVSLTDGLMDVRLGSVRGQRCSFSWNAIRGGLLQEGCQHNERMMPLYNLKSCGNFVLIHSIGHFLTGHPISFFIFFQRAIAFLDQLRAGGVRDENTLFLVHQLNLPFDPKHPFYESKVGIVDYISCQTRCRGNWRHWQCRQQVGIPQGSSLLFDEIVSPSTSAE